MAKIPRGKTETNKQRSLYIYLPSVEMVDDWKRRAAEERRSVSRFVMMRVVQSLAPEGGRAERVLKAEFAADGERLRQEKGELLEENEKLRQENRMLKMLGDNLDNELKSLRAQHFVEAGFVGERRFDKALLDLLRKGRAVEADAILARLHVDPRESEQVKGIRRQLEALEAYGLLEYDGRWWKWRG